MTDPESVLYRQTVVFGVRRDVRGTTVETNRRLLQRISPYGSFRDLPALQPGVVSSYAVPPSPETVLTYRGLPYDRLEDMLPHSAAWKQIAPLLTPHEDAATGRPITPLHGGHVGLLCTAGLLNGVFGTGEHRHIARWRSVKHVSTFVEDEGDTQVTGLDLLAFPTLYFYETGYSLHMLRQASRRSWRIGQRMPVRVKFITYAGTMQETCLRLMGKKMLVALMMKGKFSGEGLQALDTDEDLMSAMARELVEKAGVGESADAIWRDLDREREKAQPRVEVIEDEEPTPATDPPVIVGPDPMPAWTSIPLVEPPVTTKKRNKAALWPTAIQADAQFKLFG